MINKRALVFNILGTISMSFCVVIWTISSFENGFEIIDAYRYLMAAIFIAALWSSNKLFQGIILVFLSFLMIRLMFVLLPAENTEIQTVLAYVIVSIALCGIPITSLAFGGNIHENKTK